MRLATVDIGTNSVLCLIATSVEDRLHAEYEACTITRLGKGTAHTGVLSSGAMQATLDVLRQYHLEMQKQGVERCAAIGTSALRDAQNAMHFLRSAEEILNCPVEVLSGRREAELVLKGVRGAFGALPGVHLIFDIGGGSTELIFCHDATVFELYSLNLGAVRLTEGHVKNDPPMQSEMQAIAQAISEAFASLPFHIFNADYLVGVAGTVTTLATVDLGLVEYDSSRVNGHSLSREKIEEQIELFSSIPKEARQQLDGLEAARADVILAGAMIVSAILGRSKAGHFKVCDRGIRWGRMAELALE